MAAAGSLMVATLQGGRRETTRFEPDRDASGAMTDPAAFDGFLAGIRAEGAAALCSPLIIVTAFTATASEKQIFHPSSQIAVVALRGVQRLCMQDPAGGM